MTESPHRRHVEKIREYQQEGVPILMLGHLQYADLLAQYLQMNGIHIDAYFNDDNLESEDDVLTFEEVTRKYGTGFVVVIGFLSKKPVDAKMQELDGGSGIIKDHFQFGFPYPYVGKGTPFIEQNFVQEHKESLERIHGYLSDDLSKETFYAFLKSKITGDVSLINACYRDQQYFPKDILCFNDDEIVLDAGAYDGDTLEDYLREVGPFSSYHAYEPDTRYFNRLQEKKNALCMDNLCVYPKALADKPGYLNFDIRGPESSGITQNETAFKVEATTVDASVDKISFLKVDIEGAEYCALLGAQRTIFECKPKVAISVYHKSEDIIELPFS